MTIIARPLGVGNNNISSERNTINILSFIHQENFALQSKLWCYHIMHADNPLIEISPQWMCKRLLVMRIICIFIIMGIGVWTHAIPLKLYIKLVYTGDVNIFYTQLMAELISPPIHMAI